MADVMLAVQPVVSLKFRILWKRCDVFVLSLRLAVRKELKGRTKFPTFTQLCTFVAFSERAEKSMSKIVTFSL